MNQASSSQSLHIVASYGKYTRALTFENLLPALVRRRVRLAVTIFFPVAGVGAEAGEVSCDGPTAGQVHHGADAGMPALVGLFCSLLGLLLWSSLRRECRQERAFRHKFGGNLFRVVFSK